MVVGPYLDEMIHPAKSFRRSVREDGTQAWVYEYNFGDGWRHESLFEGFPPSDPKAKYRQCLEGERACPLEDCGGPGGYADYLAAISDPQHEWHHELLEWGDHSILKPSMRRRQREK